MRTCEKCGTEITQTENPTRLRERFCSKECNWAANNAKRAEKRRLRRVGRICTSCGKPIPEAVPYGAETCSRQCSIKAQAKKAAAKKKAARQAAMPPCEVCGGIIPAGTHAAARVCSEACKVERRRARWANGAADRRREQLFGVTAEQFADMLADQGNACAICCAAVPGGTGTWHVDHCHKTGTVRGLLCSDCNLGLGLFKDDVAAISRAIDYLRRPMQGQA